MKAKAIKDLSQLSDNDLFIQVSEGLEHIINHTMAIEADLKFLAEQNKKCGFNILESVFKEETAKFLILIDAIRCPRKPPENFSKHLARFNNHLPKGIYSRVYNYRPPDFGTIRRVIEQECKEYYLDGPNNFDWIFRNEILQMREENIYVDYIESEGNHIWLSPKRYYHPESYLSVSYLRPVVFEVASALWHAGCTKPDALSSIAKTWRSIQMTDDFNWMQLKDYNIQTLMNLQEVNLLETQDNKIWHTIIDKWLFPLHSLDITLNKNDKKELKEARDQKFFEEFY